MALLNAVKYIGVQTGNIESMWQIVKCRIKQCWQVMNQARKGEKYTFHTAVYIIELLSHIAHNWACKNFPLMVSAFVWLPTVFISSFGSHCRG